MLEISELTERFLAKTQIGILGITDSNRNPHLSPMWYQWENGSAYMFTARNTVKWANISKQRYGSLCVDKRESPYAAIILSGLIVESDRSVYDLVLSMALRYYGEREGQKFADNYKGNPPNVVAFTLVPDRIVSTLEK